MSAHLRHERAPEFVFRLRSGKAKENKTPALARALLLPTIPLPSAVTLFSHRAREIPVRASLSLAELRAAQSRQRIDMEEAKNLLLLLLLDSWPWVTPIPPCHVVRVCKPLECRVTPKSNLHRSGLGAAQLFDGIFRWR